MVIMVDDDDDDDDDNDDDDGDGDDTCEVNDEISVGTEAIKHLRVRLSPIFYHLFSVTLSPCHSREDAEAMEQAGCRAGLP